MNQGTHTSNEGLKEWFKKEEDEVLLNEIQDKKEHDKIKGYRRIAYQIPESAKTACGRSFEDAFMIANKSLFGLTNEDCNNLENEAFEKAKKKKNSKANFAIELALDEDKWITPHYIEEGLLWLAENCIESEKVEDKKNV